MFWQIISLMSQNSKPATQLKNRSFKKKENRVILLTTITYHYDFFSTILLFYRNISRLIYRYLSKISQSMRVLEEQNASKNDKLIDIGHRKYSISVYLSIGLRCRSCIFLNLVNLISKKKNKCSC